MEDLRRRNSLTSSETGESAQLVDQEEIPSLDSPVTESMPTEWTDEKHSLYLKSMEASFVNQLFGSMGILGFRSQKEDSSESKPSSHSRLSTRNSSGQFKTMRSGCWQKINFDKGENQVNRTEEAHGLLINPWIRHYRSTGRHHVVASTVLQDTPSIPDQEIDSRGKKAVSGTIPSSSKKLPMGQSSLCCQHSVESNAEVSDQNFINEFVEEEKASLCGTQRRKSLPASALSSDQVVPLGRFPVTTDSSENHR